MDDSGRNRACRAGFRRRLQEPMTVRVLVADGYPVVRAGLRQFLDAPDVAVVGEAATGAEAVSAAARLRPDVVVLDAALADACREIPAAVVLATSVAPDLVAAAAQAGAAAYLVKDLEGPELLDAVRRVAAGERLVDPRAGAAMFEARASLSSQEVKVLTLAAEGCTNREIGSRLHLSRHTVKEYLSNAMRKLGVDSRVSAVVEAGRRGLLDPSRLPKAS
jgi:two-component system, NarL family, response regulator DevR